MGISDPGTSVLPFWVSVFRHFGQQRNCHVIGTEVCDHYWKLKKKKNNVSACYVEYGSLVGTKKSYPAYSREKAPGNMDTYIFI